MTEMNAFERQVAVEVGGLMGPVLPVDDARVMAEVIAAGAPMVRRRPTRATAGLAAAAAIVALFGGLLLAQGLTEPTDDGVLVGASPSARPESTDDRTAPESTVRTDVLPDANLETEEVAPGVLRIIGDGVNDVAAAMSEPGRVSVSAGHDGSVWLQSSRWAMSLGRPGLLEHPMRTGSLQVAPEGKIWVKSPDPEALGEALWPDDVDIEALIEMPMVLESFDGGEWTIQPLAKDVNRGDPNHWLFDITSDGSLWFASTPNGARIARLGPEGWERLEGRSPGMGLLVTDDGTIWSQDNGIYYEDGRMRPIRMGDEETRVGRDGTVWLVWTGDGPMRLEREDENVREACAAVGGQGVQFHQIARLSVAPDGSLWGSYREGREPDRLIRFDCTGWSFPLGDVPMARPSSMAIADDGSVWVVTERDLDAPPAELGATLRELYVITPEAFATDE